MPNKVTTAADAVSLIQDGDTVCTSGFVGVGTPDELLLALEKRFIGTGTPRKLTLLHAATSNPLNTSKHDTSLIVPNGREMGYEWATKQNAHMKWAFATNLDGMNIGCAGNI